MGILVPIFKYKETIPFKWKVKKQSSSMNKEFGFIWPKAIAKNKAGFKKALLLKQK